MLKNVILLFLLLFTVFVEAEERVLPGIDLLLQQQISLLRGKRVAILTNQTGVNVEMKRTTDLLIDRAEKEGFEITALFSPEHGLEGSHRAEKWVADQKHAQSITVFSLYGKTVRPTKEMLRQVDLILCDIQEIGSRSYTYITTLFYVMEEAAKYGKEVVVLDRPNPINGIVVDGPLLEDPWRSMVGYVNVPYCHGMTIGELARFFNEEYRIGCLLRVIPMRGWQRTMTFADTKLDWIPPSPQIPEPETPRYYPMTGILGELQFVSIGIGYTLPFKIVGAPWINAEKFAEALNKQNFPGVKFHPYHFTPFFGRFAQQECHGVLIYVEDHLSFLPVSTQYLILGILKSLYPKHFQEAVKQMAKRKEMFCKVNGTEDVYRILMEEKHLVWKLKSVHQKERKEFIAKREKYLIPDYDGYKSLKKS